MPCAFDLPLMHTHARTTDDVTTENTEQRRECLHVIFVLSGKQSTTAYVLQSLKVSIGIKGLQIRLRQLKAERVLLLK